MQIIKEPFELVIHIDGKGTRATASYRIQILDDSGALIDSATSYQGVTLAELGAVFPWSEFINATTQGLLVKSEADTAAVVSAQAEVATLKAEAVSTGAAVLPVVV